MKLHTFDLQYKTVAEEADVTYTQTHKQYCPLYCIGLIGAYSNYTDKSAIPSHWHLVVTRQQLLPRCEVLCAYGLSGQSSIAQVDLRQVACRQVVWRWRESRREGEGKRRERGKGRRLQHVGLFTVPSCQRRNTGVGGMLEQEVCI